MRGLGKDPFDGCGSFYGIDFSYGVFVVRKIISQFRGWCTFSTTLSKTKTSGSVKKGFNIEYKYLLTTETNQKKGENE